MDIHDMLLKLKNGEISVEDAEIEIKKAPFVDIGIAKIDTHRKVRQGCAEVVYGEGKSREQIKAIVDKMLSIGQDLILITRIDEEKARAISSYGGFKYYKDSRLAIIGNMPKPNGRGRIVIATGGTSDQCVAEEAALTAEVLGNEVVRLYDVGVAGLHRILKHIDEIMSAKVVVAIAGMEGALASVIGGLTEAPVIAVPTSVGYGSAFDGLAALLSMLNSCSSGVSVVNIDNGFGAGFLASRINHIGC